jgi:hypothetical protein
LTPDKCSRCGRTKKQALFAGLDIVWVRKGYALCRLCLENEEYRNRTEPEIQEIRKRIRNNPQDTEAYCSLGRLLIPDGLYHYRYYPVDRTVMEESCEVLAKALRLGPQDPIQRGNACFNLGISTLWLAENGEYCHERKELADGYFRMAEKEFKVVLSYEPDNEGILNWLELIYGRLGRHKKRDEIGARLTELRARKSIGLSSGTSKPRVSPREKGLAFEAKCMKWLRLEDFDVQSTSTTGDGGVDIIAICSRPIVGGTYVVQCKNWGRPVDEPTVRDLGGVVEKWKAVKGILISNSGFTSAAHTFVKGMRLELIDGHQLNYLLSSVSRKH